MPYGKLTVPLGLGIQTDVDDKLLPVGKVVRLENGVWQRNGEVLKRNGSTSLGTQYAAGTPGSMPASWQMATHKGALVTLSKAGPRPIGVYSPQIGKWIAPAGSSAADNINGVVSKLRGQLLHRRGTVFRSNSAGSSARVYAPDIASNGTYALVAWVLLNDTALTATAQAQIIEISTGKTLFTHSVVVSYTASAVRCVFANGDFQLVYVDGANIKIVTWSATNLNAGTGAASGVTTLTTDAVGTGIDVIANGVQTLVLYAGGASVMRIIKTTSGALTSIVNLTTAAAAPVGVGVCAWMSDLSGAGAVSAIVGNVAQGITVQWNVVLATGQAVSSYTVDASVTDLKYLVGHTITNAGSGEFVVLYYKNGGAGAQRTLWGRRTVASGITTGTWIWDAAIGSKPLLNNGQFYALMAYESNTQGALFAVRVPTNLTDATDGNRTPSARMCTNAIGTRDVYVPPSMYQLSTDVFLTATKLNTRLVQVATAPTTFDTGVDTIRLTFNPTNVNGPREFADSLYVCGGVLGAFDGLTFAEEGFHLAPEAPTLTQQIGGSLTLLGNYVYRAVYRYTDEYGRLRRSEPSPAIGTTLTGSNQGIQVAVRTLKLHGHLGFSNGAIAGKVVIELYRNRNGESTLELVAVVANDETVSTVTIVDTQSDTALISAEILYTTGGVLPFEPPPAALATAPYKDRLAVIDADDPTRIAVSLPLVETEGPRFNGESGVRVDDGRGDLTCHAAIDDRLIAFKADSVYTVPGDGPDADGNGFFGLPSIIASGIGCSEPRSIVQVPDGIMFRSSSTRSGIFLVNRGLAVEYIGAPVQEYLQTTPAGTAITVVDAVHLPGLQRTKFYLSSGYALVYDHITKLWSVDTNQTALAATAWKSTFANEARPVYQISSSNLFHVIEDFSGATFDDTSSPVEMYVETPWLSLADLKGFFRFKRIQLSGEKRIVGDPSDPGYILEVSLFKDNATSAFYTATKTMAVTDDPNDVEVRYSTQLSTLKVGVRVKMNPTDGSNFAGPKLTALAIVYKVNEGLRKVPYTNRLT